MHLSPNTARRDRTSFQHIWAAIAMITDMELHSTLRAMHMLSVLPSQPTSRRKILFRQSKVLIPVLIPTLLLLRSIPAAPIPSPGRT